MIPKAEVVRHKPEVEAEYNELGARLRELRDELGSVNGEINQITGSLGELVASGKGYEKQIKRLATLRAESEALEAGVLFVNNQRDLLQRMNPWLRSR